MTMTSLAMQRRSGARPQTFRLTVSLPVEAKNKLVRCTLSLRRKERLETRVSFYNGAQWSERLA
jgi:NADH:ubiquinone oxidoreductase subunit C